MTDINKAIAFAKECLKWEEPYSFAAGETVIDRGVSGRVLTIDSFAAIQSTLSGFLAKRFLIQINRGTSTLFQWSVWVGLQNRMNGPSVYDHGRGEGDDLLDAIFDACVAAVKLYPDA
jgi:hypothetical protein